MLTFFLCKVQGSKDVHGLIHNYILIHANETNERVNPAAFLCLLPSQHTERKLGLALTLIRYQYIPFVMSLSLAYRYYYINRRTVVSISA